MSAAIEPQPFHLWKPSTGTGPDNGPQVTSTASALPADTTNAGSLQHTDSTRGSGATAGLTGSNSSASAAPKENQLRSKIWPVIEKQITISNPLRSDVMLALANFGYRFAWYAALGAFRADCRTMLVSISEWNRPCQAVRTIRH